MTELVLSISRSLGIESSATTFLSRHAILGFALIALQILDGVLTGLGMNFFGTDMEGNFLLRGLMHAIGIIPALLVTKSFAIAVIVLLVGLCTQVKWLPLAMKAVIGLYLIAAVGPWTVILVRHIW